MMYWAVRTTLCSALRSDAVQFPYQAVPYQSTFQQTLGDKFTFQQDNNLKHKAKYTLELLSKTTLNVPGWPIYSFDLNRLENLWQDLKMTV